MSRSPNGRITALIALIALIAPGAAGPATGAPDAAEELAQRYAPVTMLRAQDGACDRDGEQYVPMPVQAVLDSDRVALRRLGPPGSRPTTVTTGPGVAGIAGLGPDFELDFPGNPLSPGCTFERDSAALMTGRRPTTYAHVATEPGHRGLALQYWFFWYFNDWNNRHEGDWEMIQLAFDADTPAQALAVGPSRVAYAQHEGGQVRSWSDPTVRREGTHPLVFPGRGSHASYFDDGLYLGTGRQGAGLGCDDTRHASRRVPLTPVVVPTDPAPRSAAGWLTYEGHWGQNLSGFNGAPTGPTSKEQWREPMRWMDALRSNAAEVPGSDAFGPSTTGFFCGAVAGVSMLVIRASDSPWTVIVPLVAALLAILLLWRRTAWRPADPDPIELRRRSGQILVAARRLWRRHIRSMAGIGTVFVMVAALTAALTQLILMLPWIDALGRASANRGAFVGSIEFVAGLGTGGIAVAIASAGTVAGVGALAAGGRIVVRDAYAATFRRIGAVVWTLVLSSAAVTLLSLSIVGIPYAVKKGVDWVFATQAVILEGRSGRDALRRSTELVRGRWWSTLVFILAVAGIGLLLGPIIGIALIYVTSSPPQLVNLVSSLVFMVSVPYMTTATTFLWMDRRLAAAEG